MLVRSNITEEVFESPMPLILALTSGGESMGWINYEDYAYYASKGKIKWDSGEYEVILRGGTNAKTGMQSKLIVKTIVALDCNKSPTKYRNKTPTLTNATLFSRDLFICAYCGVVYKRHELTRDHVVPSSKGGLDTWENCVTACVGCNQWKNDRTPEQAGMQLLYVPYTPNYNEHLILQNRRILADQRDFLLKGVSPHSRCRLQS